MAKLIDDPKVAELVAKHVEKARKEERSRAIKHAKEAPLHEDKAVAKHQKSLIAQIVGSIKGVGQ